MESKVIYELSDKDLEAVIDRKLADLSKRSVLDRFRDRLISAKAVAEIHQITPDTVLKYAKAKLIPYERQGKLYKFSLGRILEIDLHEIRRQS